MRKRVVTISILALLALFSFNLEAAKPKPVVVKYWVSVHCNSCKQKIMDNLPFEKGIKQVEIDVATKIVEVTYDGRKTDSEKIKKAIEKLGYTVKSPEEAALDHAPSKHDKCDDGHDH